MGLDLTYQAGEASFTCRLPLADWQALEVLREHVPAEVAICFNTPDFGETVRIERHDLRAAAATIEALIVENPHFLPVAYEFAVEKFRLDVMPGQFISGGLNALRMPGDPDHFYHLTADVNELSLTKFAANPDDTGIVEVRDLRSETEILTESVGKIQFRQRRVRSKLRQVLRNIVAYTDDIETDEVLKTLG